jgi:hypothetical protein
MMRLILADGESENVPLFVIAWLTVQEAFARICLHLYADCGKWAD